MAHPDAGFDAIHEAPYDALETRSPQSRTADFWSALPRTRRDRLGYGTAAGFRGPAAGVLFARAAVRTPRCAGFSSIRNRCKIL
ncbi:hypothetical protein THIX_90363 [Thiomonas sp. X19]|nr:hypothetical protein THIX_90363 [Thiomonas sp. X19]